MGIGGRCPRGVPQTQPRSRDRSGHVGNRQIEGSGNESLLVGGGKDGVEKRGKYQRYPISEEMYTTRVVVDAETELTGPAKGRTRL